MTSPALPPSGARAGSLGRRGRYQKQMQTLKTKQLRALPAQAQADIDPGKGAPAGRRGGPLTVVKGKALMKTPGMAVAKTPKTAKAGKKGPTLPAQAYADMDPGKGAPSPGARGRGEKAKLTSELRKKRLARAAALRAKKAKGLKLKKAGKIGALAAGGAYIASKMLGDRKKEGQKKPSDTPERAQVPEQGTEKAGPRQDPSIGKKDGQNRNQRVGQRAAEEMQRAPVAKAATVKPERVNPQAGQRVRALRQRHNIAKGGNITGEEAFVSAAATAIAGQVPGIYNTADKIAGFLGNNLKPLGLAGLAGGATYVIARYLAARRTGKPFMGGGARVAQRAKRVAERPGRTARRPAMAGLYGRGASKRRQRMAA